MRIHGKFVQGTTLGFAVAYRQVRARLPAPRRMFSKSHLAKWATDEKICGVGQSDEFAVRVLLAGKKAGVWSWSPRVFRWVVS